MKIDTCFIEIQKRITYFSSFQKLEQIDTLAGFADESHV